MAAATVLWTVQYPEHDGDVMVPAAHVPRLAWFAAGATVVAAAGLLAVMPRSDTATSMDIPGDESYGFGNGDPGEAVLLPWFGKWGIYHRLFYSSTCALQGRSICNRDLEPMLALVIVLLCMAYSAACVDAGAASGATIHALVLLAAFATSFVFLVNSATAVVWSAIFCPISHRHAS